MMGTKLMQQRLGRPPRTVLVAGAQVPFQRGGAEWHLEALRQELVRRGLTTDVVQLPFSWDPRREALRSLLSWRLLDVSQAAAVPIDLVIATRFPSYALRHPNKIVWLFHPFRQAYDLHEAGIDGFPDTPEGRALRRHVIELDTRLLKECRALFTTSDNNARRLDRYTGLRAEVLRLPLQDPRRWHFEGLGDYVLSVGRLEPLKRTELLVRAATQLPAPLRVVIVGEGSQRAALESLARDLGVDGRVEFRGFLADEEVRLLYARCGAVFYAPFDEDYGLVTLEAFEARKPVVTTSDAGGPLEFVRDGENGLVTPPEPVPLGRALARLLEDRPLARRLGEAGHASTRGLNWDRVIERLVEAGS
jgi:glycosyltransferase involved in cell wall biosynthesis